MTPKTKRMAILWLKNMSYVILAAIAISMFIAIAVMFAVYFGTEWAMIGFIMFSLLVAFGIMCYNIADEQYRREQQHSQKVMHTLKQERF